MTGRRQFVDTNVLIYAYDLSAGFKRDRARQLLDELWAHRTGAVSTQVLQEFYVSITRKVRRPVVNEDAFALVAGYAAWHVFSPGAGDVLEAITLHQREQISFWDALVLRSASRLGCDILWSEDLSAGRQYGGVTVSNPFA